MTPRAVAFFVVVFFIGVSAAQGHDDLAEARLEGELLARQILQQQILTYIAERDGKDVALRMVEQARSLFIEARISAGLNLRRKLRKMVDEGTMTKKEVGDILSRVAPKFKAHKSAGLRYLDLLKASQTLPERSTR